ncbi:MAG: transcription-repair coupling factor [Candidatus Marinimicrobia bacterium]|nr:transcription-repair coupling factor [Candidatus Neomarinimicrobiota bacterium]
MNVEKIYKILEKDESYLSFYKLLGKRQHINLLKPPLGFFDFLIYGAVKRNYFPIILFDSEIHAENFYADILSFYNRNSVGWIPLFKDNNNLSYSQNLKNHTAHFLEYFHSDKIKLLITSPDIFSYNLPTKTIYQNNTITLTVNSSYQYDWFIAKIEELKYDRVDLVEHNGEYCIRGGIVDIYPFGSTYPQRVEFFGDQITSIRSFNPTSQISFKEIKKLIIKPTLESLESKIKFNSIFPKSTVVFDINCVNNSNNNYKLISLTNDIINPSVKFNVISEPSPKTKSNNIYKNINENYTNLFVFYGNVIHKEKIKKIINNSPASYLEGTINSGFLYHNQLLCVLTDRQILNYEKYENPDKYFIPDKPKVIHNKESIKYGDYVVHIDHGIGLFLGTRKITHNNIESEELIIEYQNEDKVYTPIKYLNKIYHYSSTKKLHPRLDKLGGGRWDATKKKTKNYAKKVAFNLIKLYKERKQSTGYAFNKHRKEMLELQSSFPYDETADQINAINEINMDMEKPTIMDRLICGDVGFGKTEIAIRATFKAVLSGKQVAILVPTTTLCFQHYETFKERLEPFGVNVNFLNRFKTNRETKSIATQLINNHIDVIIGTHKILSNKLFFKNLGLLIVDEEHRFGVNDKERLQNMKRNVDVITMTATPIPRTLQLSLVGMRDITKIETPPKERLPIKTKIIYWNETTIKNIIQREFNRNGQVIIVHNSIVELDSLLEKITEMFPDHSAQIGHGKMKGKYLEKLLLNFFHNNFDILITTTIIESGIDIPNANTLIVLNSHRFGLSQLYQIRGRVGRSYRKAYAYFLLPQNKHISPIATKRLKTLEYYTDLGSGYQIAMHDLEIRGGGNIFGADQSGHINKMGFEYFNKILSDEFTSTNSNGKSEKSQMLKTEISLELESQISETYIKNEKIRLSYYRQIGDASSQTELSNIQNELKDRFGTLPRATQNLFIETDISLRADKYYIKKIFQQQNKIFFYFNKDVSITKIQKGIHKLIKNCNSNHVHIEFSMKKDYWGKIIFVGNSPLDLLNLIM